MFGLAIEIFSDSSRDIFCRQKIWILSKRDLFLFSNFDLLIEQVSSSEYRISTLAYKWMETCSLRDLLIVKIGFTR